MLINKENMEILGETTLNQLKDRLQEQGFSSNDIIDDVTQITEDLIVHKHYSYDKILAIGLSLTMIGMGLQEIKK